MEYRIYEKYKNLGYAREALEKFLEVTDVEKLFIVFKKEDLENIEMLKDLGFQASEGGDLVTLRYSKPEKQLKKIPN